MSSSSLRNLNCEYTWKKKITRHVNKGVWRDFVVLKTEKHHKCPSRMKWILKKWFNHESIVWFITRICKRIRILQENLKLQQPEIKPSPTNGVVDMRCSRLDLGHTAVWGGAVLGDTVRRDILLLGFLNLVHSLPLLTKSHRLVIWAMKWLDIFYCPHIFFSEKIKINIVFLKWEEKHVHRLMQQ